ncbi:hypothetical protein GCM10019059_21390 [Camelimonas fluminis]|nr:hypothetical protein GCM10019059_21390 [Camelimonas fluminis]
MVRLPNSLSSRANIVFSDSCVGIIVDFIALVLPMTGTARHASAAPIPCNIRIAEVGFSLQPFRPPTFAAGRAAPGRLPRTATPSPRTFTRSSDKQVSRRAGIA